MDTSNTEYKDYNIELIQSDDGGQTWTEPVYINDDYVGQGAMYDQFHPWLFCNEEGTLISVFYDQRTDSINHYKFDLFAAYSFDGGNSFTTNHRISEVSIDPDNLKSSGTDGTTPTEKIRANADRAGKIAEYIGVTASKDHVNAIWTDTRNGNQDVYGANWVIPLLEPRLTAPPDNSLQPPQALFEWSTAWKQDQDRYRIEVSMDPSFLTTVVSAVVDTNFFPQDTFTNEGVYFWRVKALTTNGLDSSEYSLVWSFEIDLTPPDAPDLLLPPDSSITDVPTPFFDWTTSVKLGAPVAYDLYISTDSSFLPGPNTRIYAGLTESEHVPPDSLEEDSVHYWRVMASDLAGNSSPFSVANTVTYIPYICGDVDGNADFNVADLTYLVDYFFRGGPPPPIMEAANVDGVNGLNVADLTYLIDYLFRGGPEPVCGPVN
jgi:hypothetical protein